MAEADPTPSSAPSSGPGHNPPGGTQGGGIRAGRAQPGGIRPTSMPLPPAKPTWHLVVGLALVVPALVLLITSYVEPTVWAIRASVRSLDILRGGAIGELPAGGQAGIDNYRLVLDSGFGRSLGFALSLAVVPLLVVWVIAPVLAVAAHRAGRRARLATRALLALPLAAFAPAAVAVAWRVERVERDNVADAAGLVREASWLGGLGLTCALAVTLYLAVLRRADPARRPWPALAAAGGLAGLVTAAVVLQAFTYPYVLAGGGRTTDTPLLAMFTTSLVRFEFGPAAAISTLLLAILAVLGLVCAALMIVSGLRLEVDPGPHSADDPDRPGAPRGRPAGVVRRVELGVTAGLLLAVLGLSLYALLPWLRHAAGTGPLPSGFAPPGQVLIHTWLPPAISALVGVGMAAVAGFGIGALRPFGRRSELLLLPFAPYLLVGLGPLGLRAYAEGATADRLDSLLGLVPPTRLSVAALFVFTLLFRGQAVQAEQRRQRGGAASGWWRGYLLPALPMLAIALLVTWVGQAQDLLWPALSGSGKHATGPVLLVAQLRDFAAGTGEPPYGLVMPPVLLIILVLAAVAAQLGYLDRVALRAGRPEYPGGPRT